MVGRSHTTMKERMREMPTCTEEGKRGRSRRRAGAGQWLIEERVEVFGW
jgi:hypothetical protein